MIAYKIVKVDTRTGKMYSSFVRSDKTIREYRIGKTTRPIPDTPLFAYKTSEEAFNLIFYDYSNSKILECNVELCERQDYIIPSTEVSQVKEMFSFHKDHGERNKGILFCKSITPRRVV
jgi:hypothetical protein